MWKNISVGLFIVDSTEFPLIQSGPLSSCIKIVQIWVQIQETKSEPLYHKRRHCGLTSKDGAGYSNELFDFSPVLWTRTADNTFLFLLTSSRAVCKAPRLPHRGCRDPAQEGARRRGRGSASRLGRSWGKLLERREDRAGREQQRMKDMPTSGKPQGWREAEDFSRNQRRERGVSFAVWTPRCWQARQR